MRKMHTCTRQPSSTSQHSIFGIIEACISDTYSHTYFRRVFMAKLWQLYMKLHLLVVYSMRHPSFCLIAGDEKYSYGSYMPSHMWSFNVLWTPAEMASGPHKADASICDLLHFPARNLSRGYAFEVEQHVEGGHRASLGVNISPLLHCCK